MLSLLPFLHLHLLLWLKPLSTLPSAILQRLQPRLCLLHLPGPPLPWLASEPARRNYSSAPFTWQNLASPVDLPSSRLVLLWLPLLDRYSVE